MPGVPEIKEATSQLRDNIDVEASPDCRMHRKSGKHRLTPPHASACQKYRRQVRTCHLWEDHAYQGSPNSSQLREQHQRPAYTAPPRALELKKPRISEQQAALAAASTSDIRSATKGTGAEQQ
ncbi:hypothetical protein NDU88_008337 [Pleurodeles waltl]|uniref:Uncharacterized protein n=1 Tax=Pleurodeles waltl TaxID=8319 RepID=A0AAV7PU35_PLEWA|nr:hypothetical protein NDU88_008337 [Pleurodeles waltl]